MKKKAPFYKKPKWYIGIITTVILGLLGGKYFFHSNNQVIDSKGNQNINIISGDNSNIKVSNTFENKTLKKDYVQRGKCIIPNSLYGVITKGKENLVGVKLIITNRATYESEEVTTEGNGAYLISIGNLNNCWLGGDEIEFKICYNEKCHIRTEVLPPLSGGYYTYNFDLDKGI